MSNEAVIDAYLGTHHDKPLTGSGEALTAHHEESVDGRHHGRRPR
ncbi:MAG: hypothetical protein R2687_01095 [Candidatus Nanopelagicales bacterium]